MSTTKRNALVLQLLILAPVCVEAQRAAPIQILPLTPVEGGAACALRTAPRGPVWDAVLTPSTSSPAQLEHDLERLRDSLRLESRADPSGVDALYDLAVVLGRLTEAQEGAAKVRTAQELSEVAGRVLTLEPSHAGAHHILGRLHAAVMRMGRLKRFVATQILGGSALSSASWDAARRHLEAAVRRDPCTPDHLYELARLHSETGDPGEASLLLQELARIVPSSPYARHVGDKAAALLADLHATTESGP
jgi:hypothetical protein